MIIAFLFLLGLAVGSFLNVVILRGERAETLGGRSHCESCGRTLSARELIPLISFAIQKGRCRACGAALSWQYPAVEFATGACFALAGVLFSPLLSPNIGALALFSLLLAGMAAGIVIFMADVRAYTIPHGPTGVLLAIGIIIQALVYLHIVRAPAPFGFTPEQTVFASIGAAFLFALFFASLWLFSGGTWMGLGDAKLIFATSLAVGFPISIAAFLYSFWLGGLTGILAAVVQKKTLKRIIPFGPFILLGTLLAYVAAHYFPPVTRLLFFF